MKALIDGDILLYELGSCTDDEGHPLKWPFVKSRVDGKIHQIKESAGCDEYEVFITGDNNFRKEEATIKPYKGQRKSEKPVHYQKIKDYLLATKNHPVTLCEDWEADDGMSMAQDKPEGGISPDHHLSDLVYETVICSRDKDLKITPGWHYSWGSGKQKEQPLHWITEEEGQKWFFTQLLMGDSTDNIPGLYRVGEKNAKKLLERLSEPLELYSVCQHQYEVRFGSYWKMFMHENARLLWMMQTETDDVRDWLNSLEEERSKKEAADTSEGY